MKQLPAQPTRKLDHIDLFWDDEMLRDIAQRFGIPEPGVVKCHNIRQQAKDALSKAPLNSSVTTDGDQVYVHTTNGHSLAFAFRQQHVERDVFHATWWRDEPNDRIIAEEQLFRVLRNIQKELSVTVAMHRFTEECIDRRTGMHITRLYVRHAQNCTCQKCQDYREKWGQPCHCESTSTAAQA